MDTECILKSYMAPHVPGLDAYVPGEQPQADGFIKLNTNENPYPPSPRVLAAARDAASEDLRKYPDPLAAPLREAAAHLYGLAPLNVLVGNGSDELLTLCIRCFVPSGVSTVVYPRPTYVLYRTLAGIQNARTTTVNYPRDYAFPEALFRMQGNLMLLANPNSPSGSWVSPDVVKKLSSTFKGIVVADEAYAEFAPASAIPLVWECPNLLVLRSFSKSHSLAGLRLGLAVGNRTLIEGLRKVQDSYPVDRVAIAAGTAALQDTEWTARNAGRIKATREQLIKTLRGLGIEVLPSHANFIMARFGSPGAKRIYNSLKKRKILVRFFNEPDLDDALRITIGTEEECATLVTELRNLLR